MHLLLFENGDEIDLAKASLISAAKPKPIHTPRVNLTGRNNFNSKSLGPPPLSNRTPMPGMRSKASGAATESEEADQEDPLARMVTL